MASTSHKLYVWDNGRKLKDTNDLEAIFRVIAVSADGNDNGLNISESAGKFSFNSKVLSGIGSGTAAGEALSYSQRGAASGVASLDSAGKVPVTELPNSIMEYKGTFNPSTHVPNLQNAGTAIKSGVVIQGLTYAADVAGAAGNLISLTYVDPAAPSQALSVGVVGNAITVNLATNSGSLITSTADDVKAAIEGVPAAAALVDITGTGATALTAQAQTYLVGGADAANAGDVYKATAGGAHNFGAGAITFVTGDYAIFNGAAWELSHSGADAVISVNGKSGAVTLNTDEVPEGTANKYYSSTLFDASLATKTTDNLTEGTTNKYYSGTLFDASLATKTTDNLTEGTTNKYYSGTLFDASLATKTTDNLTEGTGNLYYASSLFDADLATKTTDNLTEGTTNLYFATGFAAATTDGLSEGTTNLYFSGKTTDDLPEGTVNKYFTGVPNFAAFVNKDADAITVGQFVKMTTAGQVTKLTSADSVNDESFFACAKDATVAADGTANFYLPEVGARVSGYSGLDVTKLVYAHATTPGSYTQTRPVAGKVITLGKPISATEIVFLGRFEYEII